MPQKLIILLLPFLAGCFQAAAQSGMISGIGENFRVYPSNVNQTEVFITNSPQNSNILFSSCNTLTFIPFFISEGIYVSTDGGYTWGGSDSCSGEPLAFHGGDPGIAIDKDGTFILTRLGRSPFTGLYSHYSTDNGNTWSAQAVISTDDLERAVLATDVFPSSPYYGRTYAAWVRFAPPYPMMIAYTDNGGATWSEARAINDPPNRSAGGDICIGPGGEVYVCWAGVTDITPFKEIHAGFAASLNGGASWEVDETAFQMNGITGLLPEKGNIRVNGLPGIAVDTTRGGRYGWIYIVSGQKEFGAAGSQPDIILNRSADGGANWSEGIRVNQDGTAPENIQYFPGIHVDRFGGLNIIYYDDRNTSSDSAGVFLSRSQDGGSSWTDYEISDHNFKPVAIGGLGQGYQGDNIDLTSTYETLWPVWMDNSSGMYQVWSVPLHFSDLNSIGEAGNRHQARFTLKQNQPNPFGSHTWIEFDLKRSAHIKLMVHDQEGNEIALLIDKYMQKGQHRIRLDRERIHSPGTYFITLSDGISSAGRKILCLP